MPAPVTYGSGIFLSHCERVPVRLHRVGQVLAADVVVELQGFGRRSLIIGHDLALWDKSCLGAKLLGGRSLGLGRIDSPDWVSE